MKQSAARERDTGARGRLADGEIIGMSVYTEYVQFSDSQDVTVVVSSISFSL